MAPRDAIWQPAAISFGESAPVIAKSNHRRRNNHSAAVRFDTSLSATSGRNAGQTRAEKVANNLQRNISKGNIAPDARLARISP